METIESASTRTKAMMRRITNTCNLQFPIHLVKFLYISLNFYTFLYISIHFHTFLSISFHFFSFLYISLYFLTIHYISLHFFKFLYISSSSSSGSCQLFSPDCLARKGRHQSHTQEHQAEVQFCQKKMKKGAKKLFQFCQQGWKRTHS